MEQNSMTAQHKTDAEYVPGIGWMYVLPTGRYGNFETEAQALRARADAIAKATGSAA